MPAAGLATSAPIPRLPRAETQGRVTPEEARAMLRAVLALFDKWALRTDEKRVLLGLPSPRTMQRWQAGEVGPLPADTVFRLGDLLGIHKALRYMFTDVARAYGWVKRPNAAFAGHSALEVMLQGAQADIARIRAYLDAERAAW